MSFDFSGFANVKKINTELMLVDTQDSQSYRINVSKNIEEESYLATTEEQSILQIGNKHFHTWTKSRLPDVISENDSDAMSKALNQIDARVKKRISRIGDEFYLSKFVKYGKDGKLSWSDRDSAIETAKGMGLSSNQISAMEKKWEGINQRLEKGSINFQLSGPVGPYYYTISDEERFIGPPNPSREESSEENKKWPTEKPVGWPADWPYPPPDDWVPPLPPVHEVDPNDWPWINETDEDGGTITTPIDGVYIEEHWYGDYYYFRSDKVDELADAIVEISLIYAVIVTGVGGAGSGKIPLHPAIIRFLRRGLSVLIPLGVSAAWLRWYAMHIRRVKRNANCSQDQNGGIMLCRKLFGMYNAVYPFCYPPFPGNNSSVFDKD